MTTNTVGIKRKIRRTRASFVLGALQNTYLSQLEKISKWAYQSPRRYKTKVKFCGNRRYFRTLVSEKILNFPFLLLSPDFLTRICFENDMREIINIQVGLYDKQIESILWQMMSSELGIDASGSYAEYSDYKYKIDAYYREISRGRYAPRVVLLNLEGGTVDQPTGRIICEENVVYSRHGVEDNQASVHFLQGAGLVVSAMEFLRNRLPRFQLAHTLGDSGVDFLSLSNIMKEYSDRVTKTHSAIPPNVCDATLSVNQLRGNSNGSYDGDNEPLLYICCIYLDGLELKYKDLNHLIRTMLQLITYLNNDLRNIVMNSVPYLILHFLTLGFVPWQSSDPKLYKLPLVRIFVYIENSMIAYGLRYERFSICIAMLREVSMEEDLVNDLQNSFMDGWIPKTKPHISNTLIAHTTSIPRSFESIFLKNSLLDLLVLIVRKMKEGNMVYRKNIHDLIKLYRQYHEKLVD